ncbi:LysR family transcriptional regulator [Vibrio nigripulchritudo]|uniref:LysR substrate-binding domain-containing protein n=1 Tax=Vibrio nigripulchritudo TaxID=28173 RepID=UPI00190D06D1|nr:LysR substrate-binding domain-containing protein [Vibrio nigripulchritudo]BCL69039.1 LysR family transcriptional regulator [Vibrio nigripulchritudo]BDU30370.1 LysR family transcriptional regulator [Vibrio nigripulchritudo]
MKIDLNDYFYFVHVVEKRGYTSAAQSLNMPKSRLSRHVVQLEERLGVRLLQRTSRNVVVTDEGKRFYKYARKLVDSMELAEAAMESHKGLLSGKVVLSCSTGVAQFALLDIITEFAKLYPNVLIEQRVSNTNVDLIAEGIDLAIRGHSDELPDSSLIQRVITKVKWSFYCAPSYLEEIGTVENPSDLAHCRVLKIGRVSGENAIHLLHNNGLRVHQHTNIVMCSEDMSTLRQATIEGLGIIALPDYVCRKPLQIGQLIQILPDWISQSATLSLLMPSRLGVPAHIKALADFIREKLPKAVVSD